jgi:hypothetical protein
METPATSENPGGSVNYDEAPIAQEHVSGIDYRVDVGRGSAVAVSRRAEGTWAWEYLAEGKFDGTRLKVKGLDYPVVSALGAALMAVMKQQSDGSSWG